MRLIALISAMLATMAVAAPPGIVNKRQDAYRCTLPGRGPEPNLPYMARCLVYPASGAVSGLTYLVSETR
jgi:hypothetical protein